MSTTTSVKVLEACIRRINEVNPILNCLVEDRFQLAMEEARNVDILIASGKKTQEQLLQEKPFLGVPFTTKDSIAVKDLHITVGVVLQKNAIATEDAAVIKLLCESGAIIIGLTNIPELCMWWESHNYVYGRTNNPYNTTRIVGGSSGGEGCIQAVAGSIFGVGSDIGGSIRMPAFFNGIFGHKPSANIVSNEGLYPESETEIEDLFLGVGPMTRHAVDLKPLLAIMAGENSVKLKLDVPVDITKLKIFYQFNNDAPLVDKVDASIIKAMKKVIEYFKLKYKLVTEEKKIGLLRQSETIWSSSMKTEKRFGMYIMEDDSKLSIYKEIFKNIFGLSGNTFIALLTALYDHSKITDEEHKHYLKLREDFIAYFNQMLGDDAVFLYPTHPTPAPYHNEPLIKPMNFSYTCITNCLTLPSTSIPLGLNSKGLPIGLQVIASHNNDRLCLAVAEELDKAFGGWIEPQRKLKK